MTDSFPTIENLSPRTWRQWWRQTPSLFRIAVWGLSAFAIFHALLAVRIVIGLQDDTAIKVIDQFGGVRYVWQSSVERFPGHHLLLAGLLGRSNRNVTGVWLFDFAADEQLQLCQSFPQLAFLSLWRSDVSSRNLSCLLQCPRLEELDLTDTDIDDDGIRILSSHPSIRRLDLTGTLVTDACIPSLANMPSLEYVELRETDVTIEGAARLQRLAYGLFGVSASDIPLKASIRWSDGEICERFPRLFDWHMVSLPNEELPNMNDRAIGVGERHDEGRSTVRAALKWIVQMALQRGDGTYEIWLSLEEVRSGSITLTIRDGKLSTNRFEFRMPITRAEAIRSEREAESPNSE